MARGITTEQGVACRFSGFVAALRSITPGSLGSGLNLEVRPGRVCLTIVVHP